ncbi:MAG: purine-nucleoside phosphorylase [Planctomycetaceae bacterium]
MSSDSRLSRSDDVAQAVRFLRSQTTILPQVGVILGTGLGGVADAIDRDITIPYADVPGFSPSTAVGHRGQLAIGHLAGVPVAVLEGRSHFYEGIGWDAVQFPTRVLAGLGIDQLILTNAVGGLRTEMSVGELMVIDDQIDLMFAAGSSLPPIGLEMSRGPLDAGSHYDRELIEQSLSVARELGISLRRGTYAAVTGPNYETRAEYRLLRKLGADMVGMSTLPESRAARSLGIRTVAFSMVTNVSNPDAMLETHGEEVARAAAAAAPRLGRLITALLDPTRRR